MSAPQLTAADIKALREADWVSFRTEDGGAHLRAYLEADRSSGAFTAAQERLFPDAGLLSHDRSRSIQVDWRLQVYSVDDIRTRIGDREDVQAYHLLLSTRYDNAWQTVVRSLRPGHQVALEWTANNNNDVLRAVGLHRDEVRLAAGVPGKPGSVFLIAATVTPDNSARMIRSGALVEAL